jgi:hypothetical protein
LQSPILGAKIGEARKEAADDKRDGDYKVAAEKCDAMAGDAKASCIATAKADFGKNCGPSDSSARPALA